MHRGGANSPVLNRVLTQGHQAPRKLHCPCTQTLSSSVLETLQLCQPQLLWVPGHQQHQDRLRSSPGTPRNCLRAVPDRRCSRTPGSTLTSPCPPAAEPKTQQEKRMKRTEAVTTLSLFIVFNLCCKKIQYHITATEVSQYHTSSEPFRQ